MSTTTFFTDALSCSADSAGPDPVTDPDGKVRAFTFRLTDQPTYIGGPHSKFDTDGMVTPSVVAPLGAVAAGERITFTVRGTVACGDRAVAVLWLRLGDRAMTTSRWPADANEDFAVSLSYTTVGTEELVHLFACATLERDGWAAGGCTVGLASIEGRVEPS